MSSKAPSGLARRSLGTTSLLFFTVSASAPMAVIAGVVVAAFATTGALGVPLSFLLLMGALYFFTVGYVAMSRYVANAGVFYAYLAQGLGRVWGVAGSLVALVCYNAIQISAYGLIGTTLSGLLSGFGWPWWMWALVVWALIGLLGVLHININARVLAVLLICEVFVIVLLDLAAFTHPAGGVISGAGLLPGNLFVTGIGGMFALGIASFIGYEVAPVYSEEARGHWAVARSSFGALLFLGIFYALSSWALIVARGPSHIVDDTRDPSVGVPFVILSQHYGTIFASIANILMVTSLFGAQLSFHNSVARYLFALGRERVLPKIFDSIGSGSRAGAPVAGSLVQSAIALIVFGAFAAAGADPVTVLFTWLGAISALGLILLMFGTSLAVIGFFRRGGTEETAWQRVIAPGIGAVVLLLILITMVVNIDSLLGTESTSPLTWILPGIIGVAAVAGIVWGLFLKAYRPAVYRGIGVGQQEPLAVLDHALAEIEV